MNSTSEYLLFTMWCGEDGFQTVEHMIHTVSVFIENGIASVLTNISHYMLHIRLQRNHEIFILIIHYKL